MKKLLQTSTGFLSILLVVFILALSPAFADIASANELIDAGDFNGAITELESILEGEPENVEALQRLASAITSLAETIDDPTEAEATFDMAARTALRAVEIDASDAESHYQRARALGRLAQFRGILQSLFMAGDIKGGFEKAIELNPNHGGALHGLAVFHAQAPFIAGGDGSQAVPLFERAIEVDPEFPIRYLEYAEILIDRNKMDDAKIQLGKLITLEAVTQEDAEDIEKGRALLAEHY